MTTHGERTIISERDREWFPGSRLSSIRDLLNHPRGELAAMSGTTDTFRLDTADIPGAPPRVFVKRYRYGRAVDRWRGALRGTLLGKTRARFEYDFLREMRSRGTKAVRPIAVGVYRKRGFVRGCLLVTEAVSGATPLDVAVAEASMSRRRRSRMVAQLAVSVRAMHDSGIFHGGLFGRNILVARTAEGHQFYYLDPDRRGRVRPAAITGSQMEFDLSDLAASGAVVATRTDGVRFLQAYFGVRKLRKQDRATARKIVSKAATKIPQERRRIAVGAAMSWLRRRMEGAASQDGRPEFRTVSAFFARIEGIRPAADGLSPQTRVVTVAFRDGDLAVGARYVLELRRGDPVGVGRTLEGKSHLDIDVDEYTWLAIVNGNPVALKRIHAGGLTITGDPSLLCPILSLVDQTG